MIGTSNRKKLFIVRREAGGIGGAEKVAHRFLESFSEFYDTQLIHAGKTINGFRIKGTKGPSWLKCLRFSTSVRKFLAKHPNTLVLSMERGVPGTIYRAGDGIVEVWKKIKYKNSKRWFFNPLYWLLPYLERMSIEGSDHIVANSKMIAGEIKCNYPKFLNKVSVIENGFNDKIFFALNHSERSKLRHELEFKQEELNFLFSGSGWDRKGFSNAITLYALIVKKYPNSHLWVAGKGSPQKYMELVKKENLNNKITFLGSVKNIEKWYQACDLLIMPTLYDPFSNSCLEALACGCPVVTTNRNGAQDVVVRSRGGLVLGSESKIEPNFISEIEAIIETEMRIEISKNVATNTVQNEIKKYRDFLLN